jgi:outer membrane protein assembly factor BamE (lipoprotein component of BamABCDE complex)
VLTAGCEPIPSNHGYVPPDDELREVQVGRDTRETVAEKIGSPVNFGMDAEESWLYISQRRETYGIQKPRLLSREIVAIRFTESGEVQNIERFDLRDGEVVTLSARVTDPSVSDLGLIRQIFGGLGTPTADQFLTPN